MLTATGVTRPKVAVIGLGAAGLVTLKNLLELEAGFQVAGFDQNDQVGGLWVWKQDPTQTTVIKSTKGNGSKQSFPYTDFPFDEDVPTFPSGNDVAGYLLSYAQRFNLNSHMRLNTKVISISPVTLDSGVNVQWRVCFSERDAKSESTEVFDRVIVTTGSFAKPRVHSWPGQEDFVGDILHSQSYKEPEPFKGKRVVVVGIANTAFDVACELVGVADRVYLSHRSGGRVFARRQKPVDQGISRRAEQIVGWLSSHFPTFTNWLMCTLLERGFRKEWPQYRDEWNFMPTPPIANAPGAVSDLIIPYLAAGKVHNLGALQRFTKSGIICDDGNGQEEEIPCDAVIFCTGLGYDYSILSAEADPTAFPAPEWNNNPHAEGLAYPNLYRTLFHPKYLDSLAFIGPMDTLSFAAFWSFDLFSQVIGQLWSGRYPIPNRQEVDKWCAENYRFALDEIKNHRVSKIGTDGRALERWCNEVAGNEINEKLGWGWSGWKFWFTHYKLCKLMLDGVRSPHIYRLFKGRDGARPMWSGAEAEIFRGNGQPVPEARAP